MGLVMVTLYSYYQMEIAEGRRERGGERELLFSAEGKRSESLVDLRLSTFSLRGKRIWGRILKG